ncbi:hypothetical protein MACH26_26630 [Planctobacterium marinum]|uniref:Beta-glucosidase n=2 Tax=Planctobacterium marinum TaxID=1631968 RepID=A0AA48KSH2_9ALTE|nr:hypothetical protein MACH26_26630 [Planctobacterium marinum]
MSLAQKIGQMTQADRMTCTPDDVYQYSLGSVLSSAGSCPEDNSPAGWLAMCDSYWSASMQPRGDLPRIPIIYGVDAIHGHNNALGATLFPHNIGMGCTRNPDLIKSIHTVTRHEVQSCGIDWVFGPNLAVASNLHWGRTYESFSEDHELVSLFGKYATEGLQNSFHMDSVIACGKHWLGDGGTAGGIDQGDTRMSQQELQQIHAAPYAAAIESGLLTIMASFSSWNGFKCHAHQFLLTELLKKQMGFDGFVVSDMQGIEYVNDDFYLAIGECVNAGIDMFMVPENWMLFLEHLRNHVEMGTVPLSRINEAVKRILCVKLAAGIFDKPSPKHRLWAANKHFAAQEHKALARQAVQESLVLLKNEHSALPLHKEANILVCGKNAHNLGHQCGGFTLNWQGVSGNDEIVGDSIWDGIKHYSGNAVLDKATTGNIPDTEVSLDTSEFDIAVVVIGETPYAEGMGDIGISEQDITTMGNQINGFINVRESNGANLDIAELYPDDVALVDYLHSRNIPIVTVLVSGRPMVAREVIAKSDAFIAAWLPGSEGKGVADVLFGESDFTGKLSFSWPELRNTSKPLQEVAAEEALYKTVFSPGYGLNYRETLPGKKAI